MVPRESKRGSSFKGAGLYYLHDKDARTAERVLFTHTENLPTTSADKALKWMAWTAIHAEDLKREAGAAPTGRPTAKPVFSFSLAWHPGQAPEKWQMIHAGRGALAALGLSDHETLMVAHRDEDHPHIHLIVNIVNPETGRAASVPYSKLKLSKWAEGYEKEHGHILCPQRVENNEKRARGENVKYREPEIAMRAELTRIYRAADSGKAFQAALEQAGYKLARGKRLVLIDRGGRLHSLTRQIDGVKAKDIRDKLRSLDLAPPPETRRQQGKKQEPEIFDRDAADRKWQESVIDAAIAKAEKEDQSPAPTFLQRTRARPKTPPAAPAAWIVNRLQERHLAELGEFYSRSAASRHRVGFSLENQYGNQERALKQEINGLELQLRGGRVRRGVKILAGRLPANAAADLEALKKSLANIEWRKEEAMKTVEAQIGRERAGIIARQEKEKRAAGIVSGGQERIMEQPDKHRPERQPKPGKDRPQEFNDTASPHEKSVISDREARREQQRKMLDAYEQRQRGQAPDREPDRGPDLDR